MTQKDLLWNTHKMIGITLMVYFLSIIFLMDVVSADVIELYIPDNDILDDVYGREAAPLNNYGGHLFIHLNLFLC